MTVELVLSAAEGQALADLLALGTTSLVRERLGLTEVTDQLCKLFPDNVHDKVINGPK